MYTKGIKKSQEAKEKKLNVSNDLIREYCRYFNVDRKSIIDALEFYPTDMIKELHDFQRTTEQK